MKITERTIQLLEEKKIYTTAQGTMRWKPGDSILVSEDAAVEPYCGFFSGGGICSIGMYSYSFSSVGCQFSIGRYSSIAKGNALFGDQHPYGRFTSSAITYDTASRFCIQSREDKAGCTFEVVRKKGISKSITIGNDVWIGAECRFKRGLKIGDGAVVAANSIVTHDVEPYTVVAGVPARCIKMRFPEKIVEQLLELKWWEYNYVDFQNMKSDISIDRFVDRIQEDIFAGRLEKYTAPLCYGKEIIETCRK